MLRLRNWTEIWETRKKYQPHMIPITWLLFAYFLVHVAWIIICSGYLLKICRSFCFRFFPFFFTRPYIRSIWNNFKNKHFMNGNGSLWTHLVFVIASVFNGRKKRTHTHTHAEVNYIPLCKSINKNKMSCNLYENETTARLKTSRAQLTAIKMPFWKWKINTFLIITHLLS